MRFVHDMATCGAPRAATRRTPRAFAPCFALDSRASAVSRVPHLFPPNAH